jgi:quinohemoprotein ethanol dehydrogenase
MKPTHSQLFWVPCLLLTILVSCKEGETSYTDAAIADESQTENWMAYGRTHNERRFYPSGDVNDANVSDLKVDWFVELPNDVGLVSTPLVVDGVLYFTGTMNVIRAVDATSGDMIWKYDPQVGEAVKGRKQIGWVHNRGISFYEGKIFTATWDGRLIALDALTGEKIWETRTFDEDSALYITGAPKAFKGKVLIGNGGTENGPTRGWVTAYDADTGAEAWKFYIVPGNPADGFESDAMAMAAETWTGEWWKHGGGGNTWHGLTYDAEMDLLYIGTGNGSPWNRKIRSPEGGDNLFLCSIVALDPDTGEYQWHYQTTPGESWDYNSNMDIVLTDLTIEGKPIKALLHAPKNGFFYVIDRENGQLVSAEPFVETSWATHIDMETGKPVEVEGARYEESPAFITPGPWGGHSWHAMSFNPNTGLAYIPAIHQGFIYSDEGIEIATWQAKAFEGGTGVNLGAPGEEPREYPASLMAWDPVAQKAAWSIPQEITPNAGTLTTAGNLLFQGRADGMLLAYDARTGKQLWQFNTGLGIAAPPISYTVDGKQYIALLVGWGGGYAGIGGEDAYSYGWSYRTHPRRLIAFSLEGKANLPAVAPRHFPKPIDDPSFEIDETLVAQGTQEYGKCAACHGGELFSGGMAPDLRASVIPLDYNNFDAVVRGGAKANLGMPARPDLTDQQLRALQHFIRKGARDFLPEYESFLETGSFSKTPGEASATH